MKTKIQERLESILSNIEFLDKRAYLTVSGEGEIKRKKINYSFPALFFCEDEELFNKILSGEIDKRERIKIGKIERLSNIEIDKLKDNLVKLIIKGELDFAKRYAKELALRDKESFIKILFNISLMDNPKFHKPLMALAMREYLKDRSWSDEIGYLVISYFCKQRYDLYLVENVKNFSDDNIRDIQIQNLALIAYKKVLDSYDYENKELYEAILSDEIKSSENELNSNIEIELIKGINRL